MATPRLCSIPNCNNPVRARGYCNRCLHRYRRCGPEAMAVQPAQPRTAKGTGKTSKFLSQIAFPYSGEDCLNWPFAKTHEGYGKARYDGRSKGAHRIVCEVVHGAPPTHNSEAAHICGNSSCVNPQHIRWASPAQNQADKISHGTNLEADRHPNAKLSNDSVSFIKRSRGIISQADLASRFGVSKSTVAMIHAGHNWKSIR